MQTTTPWPPGVPSPDPTPNPQPPAPAPPTGPANPPNPRPMVVPRTADVDDVRVDLMCDPRAT